RMLAGRAMLGGVGEHATEHSAQRVPRQHVITDVIGRHAYPYTSSKQQGCAGLPTRPEAIMVPRPHAEVSRPAGRNLGRLRFALRQNAQMKVEASVARCLRTPPDGA